MVRLKSTIIAGAATMGILSRPKGTCSTPDHDELWHDELWMEEALRAAQRALEAGEVPVGAVVILRWTHRRSGMEPQHH